MLLAIVVPCFNEEAVLPETQRRLAVLLDALQAEGRIAAGSGVHYVDDGSSDGTWALIEGFAAADARVHGLKLSRNRGHQVALLAGLLSVEADVVVSIDADLQDDLAVIPQMLAEHAQGAQVVYGVRDSRAGDTAFKRGAARGFYGLMRRMGVELVGDHADFRLMGRPAIEALRQFGEVNLFLRGIVPLIGYRSTTVRYARGERFAGRSKYPLRKMLRFALEGITSFSVVPLRVITVLGLTISLASFGMIVWVLWGALVQRATLPGWASSVVPIYFLGGIQLLSIGVLGEYVAKIYLETKARPRYFIEKRV